MKRDNNKLEKIYRKTDGYCHLCGKKLSLKNYARPDSKGCWEIEHSKPRSKGGTDHLNNLFPACIPCNREKGRKHTRTARGWYGRTRAPYSKKKKRKIRKKNTLKGGAIGAGVGGVLAGPPGAMVGSVIGAAIGNKIKPDKQ